ncbi:putative bifunctional diguanylate cyclase/phosphodiesterase [Uliginosibacterium paludis]|uniref:EAL domain-containing protein n=1 Tax=Uliginosibacterium paludis TaxID=1615952 RepID=A0ABV2CSV3_9RHOO
MTSPLLTAYLISVGIMLMTSAHALLLTYRSKPAHLNLIFMAICLSLGCFQFACARQYYAPDAASALVAHRWGNVFWLAILPLIALAMESLEAERRIFRISPWIALASLAGILLNFVMPYGYRFSAVRPDHVVLMPWGEALRFIQGSTSLVNHAMGFTSLLLAVYCVLSVRRLQRAGVRLPVRILWGSMLIMIVSRVLAALSDDGVIAVPYLGGFAFILISAAFSFTVRREMLTRELHEKRAIRALANERRRKGLPGPGKRGLDPLTGLPDRHNFITRLDAMIRDHELDDARLAVFLFDIDRLSAIKATHSVETGNAVLCAGARRLQARIRESDLLARTQGDGFALAAGHIRTESAPAVLQAKLAGVFEEAIDTGDMALRITASCGIAIFPEHGHTAEALFAAAELALQEARSAGAGQTRSFSPAMREDLRERIQFENDLRNALDLGQFFLCYQPQICATTGRTMTMEALIRWQHPEYGLIGPCEFIPLAESAGLIKRIGAWVIETACAQLARWRADGHEQLRMAVNLSARQLPEPGLAERIGEVLNRHRLTPADLELEITESVLMQDSERSTNRLMALRRLGLRLSIDDFGTGYSSLSYLRLLPVQAFKLDRSFVDTMERSETSLEICDSAIRLAKNLGLDIVAEGVETETQAQLLREMGCPLLQGYLFSRPLDAASAGLFLAADRSARPATRSGKYAPRQDEVRARPLSGIPAAALRPGQQE